MRIVSSQEIGQLGSSNGQPVFFQWRWYYSVPSLPIWALILVLLVAPKSNRSKQAWLILIPLGLLLGIWYLPAMSLLMNPSTSEGFSFLVGSGAFGWSIILLVTHWLGNLNRIGAFFILFGIMLATFLSFYMCQFNDADSMPVMLISYSVLLLILLLALTFTGYACRKNYSPRRFLGRLLLWVVLLTIALMLAYDVLLMILIGRLQLVIQLMLFLIPSAAIMGCILYLVNLPFLILAFKCPFYRERFEKLFLVGNDYRLEEGLNLSTNDVPSSAGPTDCNQRS